MSLLDDNIDINETCISSLLKQEDETQHGAYLQAWCDILWNMTNLLCTKKIEYYVAARIIRLYGEHRWKKKLYQDFNGCFFSVDMADDPIEYIKKISRDVLLGNRDDFVSPRNFRHFCKSLFWVNSDVYDSLEQGRLKDTYIDRTSNSIVKSKYNYYLDLIQQLLKEYDIVLE